MKWLHVVTFLLVIVGALNWGLIALADLNVVNALLGTMPEVEKVVYILVGVSAVYLVINHPGDCKVCSQKGK